MKENTPATPAARRRSTKPKPDTPDPRQDFGAADAGGTELTDRLFTARSDSVGAEADGGFVGVKSSGSNPFVRGLKSLGSAVGLGKKKTPQKESASASVRPQDPSPRPPVARPTTHANGSNLPRLVGHRNTKETKAALQFWLHQEATRRKAAEEAKGLAMLDAAASPKGLLSKLKSAVSAFRFGGDSPRYEPVSTLGASEAGESPKGQVGVAKEPPGTVAAGVDDMFDAVPVSPLLLPSHPSPTSSGDSKHPVLRRDDSVVRRLSLRSSDKSNSGTGGSASGDASGGSTPPSTDETASSDEGVGRPSSFKKRHQGRLDPLASRSSDGAAAASAAGMSRSSPQDDGLFGFVPASPLASPREVDDADGSDFVLPPPSTPSFRDFPAAPQLPVLLPLVKPSKHLPPSKPVAARAKSALQREDGFIPWESFPSDSVVFPSVAAAPTVSDKKLQSGKAPVSASVPPAALAASGSTSVDLHPTSVRVGVRKKDRENWSGLGGYKATGQTVEVGLSRNSYVTGLNSEGVKLEDEKAHDEVRKWYLATNRQAAHGVPKTQQDRLSKDAIDALTMEAASFATVPARAPKPLGAFPLRVRGVSKEIADAQIRWLR